MLRLLLVPASLSGRQSNLTTTLDGPTLGHYKFQSQSPRLPQFEPQFDPIRNNAVTTMDVVSTTPGCYGAYTPNYSRCSGYAACGYTCVGNNCAYAGTQCACSCTACSTFYSTLYFDATTGKCVPAPVQNIITTFAGTGTAGSSGDGGPAALAQLFNPGVILADISGNVYIADTDNHKVRLVSSTGIITTFAGTGTAGSSGDGGAATSSQLYHPKGMAVDSNSNLYIVDTDNQKVRSVSSTGIIKTFAGTGTAGSSGDGGKATSAQLQTPEGILVVGTSAVYIADRDNHKIRFVTLSTSIITTFAGTGTAGSSGDGGRATSAQLNGPNGLARDLSGNLYISDYYNNKIRLITSAGIMTTFAGTGTQGSSGDGGAATSAQLFWPVRMDVDIAGNVYIPDSRNHRIRIVSSAGIITTYAGTGTAGSSGDTGKVTSAQLNNPSSVSADISGNVYFADVFNHKVRMVAQNSSGPSQSPTSYPSAVPTQSPTKMPDVITTYAGTGLTGSSGDGGAATSAQLSGPRGVAMDLSNGDLYIADMFNHKIRIVANSLQSYPAYVLGGVGMGPWGAISGNQNAKWIWSDARAASSSNNDMWIFSGSFSSTSSYTGSIEVVADNLATIYVNGQMIQNTNFFNWGSIAWTQTTQQASINVITGTNRIVVNAQNTGGPAGLLLSVKNSTGSYVYATGSSWTFQLSNGISTYAGTGSAGSTGDGGAASSAQLRGPSGVAVDTARNVYISDSKNNKIRKVSSAGIITTLAGTGTPGNNGDGGAATSAQLHWPEGIIVDSSLNLYIADTYNNKVRKVSSTGIITTFAGTGTAARGGDGGPATSAQLNAPVAVTIDALGNIYIADSNNNKIRKVSSTGIITTFAGTGRSGTSGDGGAAISARLCNPQGLVMDMFNNLYLTDFYNNRVRVVNSTGIITTIAATGTLGTSFTYVGCYVDYTNGVRALPNLIYSNQPSYQACFQQAQLLGYQYVGFEAWNAGWQSGTSAGECWGGNNLAYAQSQGVATNCNLVLTADGNFVWAGASAMAVYDNAAISTQFKGPLGATADASGNVYIADFYHNTVQLVVPPVQTPSPTSSPTTSPPV